jgi:hypothetical protein
MDIKTKAIEKIARQLKNLGCEYMIVPETGDPVQRGNFKHLKKVPHGERAAYVEAFIRGMKPGEALSIPLGEYELEQVSQSASAACHKLFGKGNYVTRMNVEDNCIEVLCLDLDENDEAA